MRRADGHSLRVERASLAGPRLALAILAAAALLGALTSPAFAFSQRGHSFAFSFGEKGEALGQLKSPAGIAVNESTHDVYVVDAGNQRVERFNAEGEAQEVWGWGVENGAAEFQRCSTGCKAGIAGTGEAQFDYQAKLN